MEFKVRGVGIEYLGETMIEADTIEEAEDIYRDMWDHGNLSTNEYELDVKVDEA